MKAKEAIAQAKTFLSEFYAGEAVSGVRLEEVEFDEPSDSWLITLGILRPRLEPKAKIMTTITPDAPLVRTYKILRIPNSVSGRPSMKMRELHTEE